MHLASKPVATCTPILSHRLVLTAGQDQNSHRTQDPYYGSPEMREDAAESLTAAHMRNLVWTTRSLLSSGIRGVAQP